MAKCKRTSGNKKLNKQLNKLIALVITLIIGAFFAQNSLKYDDAPRVIGTVEGKVIKVSDGDTITVLNADKQQLKVRLYGIDAPETKQVYGNASRKALAAMIAGQQVTLNVLEIDQYGRSVAKVRFNDTDINRNMVEDGHAWVYTQYCKTLGCERLEELQYRARQDKIGLWKDKNPTPPWTWRKNNKK
ncbi:endonuclease YncB(thermonuclease family) [Elusimicrobium simillimum]|uniref:thermonuclease family protein n=1 Tax=Elusimicrobium simillimum TaxID=3143438 RepID=UPI003C6EA612